MRTVAGWLTLRKTKRYPTDLTDEEWVRIEPLMPQPPKRGRKVSVDLREMLNGIRYMARGGGGCLVGGWSNARLAG